VTEELAVIDNLSGKLYLIVYADRRSPSLQQGAPAPARPAHDAAPRRRCAGHQRLGAHRSHREFAKEDYLKAVAKAKEYMMAGDLMQVQIGQRIRKPYVDSPLSLYRALRSLNPSPYMYFYNFGDMQIVGASPEILVRNETRRTAARKSRCAPRRHPPARRHARARRRTGGELLADPKKSPST
jgi:anthranilate synthase component 1